MRFALNRAASGGAQSRAASASSAPRRPLMEKGGTSGPAVRMWARSELGRRWKALVALGVIAGIAGGLALAAVDGARRTSTAYAR